MIPGIHPELACAARWLPRISFTRCNIPLLRAALAVTKLKRDAWDGVTVRKQRDAGARLRVYEPQGRELQGALVWMHGGGLIVGTPAQDDQRCVTFARELGILVVSPDYRLAPRHPFPAALDDCHVAWRWTVRRVEQLGMDPECIAVGGASAGGGLAASLAQRIRDEGGPQPAGQLLVYPMLDDRTDAVEEDGATRHLVWNARSNRTGWSSYLGQPPGAHDVPRYAVPARREELAGLPPAWIGVGTLDLFYDENRDYAERLGGAGVASTFHAVNGAFHGFDSLVPGTQLSQGFIDAQIEFLRTRLCS